MFGQHVSKFEVALNMVSWVIVDAALPPFCLFLAFSDRRMNVPWAEDF